MGEPRSVRLLVVPAAGTTLVMPARAAIRSALPFAAGTPAAIELATRTATPRLCVQLTRLGTTLQRLRPLSRFRMRHFATTDLASPLATPLATRIAAESRAAPAGTAAFLRTAAVSTAAIAAALPTSGTAVIPARTTGTGAAMAMPAIDVPVEWTVAIVATPVVAEIEADEG